jgi:hypothetical protein
MLLLIEYMRTLTPAADDSVGSKRSSKVKDAPGAPSERFPSEEKDLFDEMIR